MASECRIKGSIAAFQAAGLGERSWSEALESLALATGSRGGQLIGFGSEAALQFNWTTSLSAECLDEFATAGWADPARNPRVRTGLSSAELAAFSEADFGRDADRLPFYTDFSRRWDIPFSCASTLLTHDGVLVGMAVLRSRREGQIEARQREAFEAIAPHVRHAVRTRMMLGDSAGALLAGAMDSLHMAAFVCRPDGQVIARSALAEGLLSLGEVLTLREGRLAGRHDAVTRALASAIHAVGAVVGEAGRGVPAPPALVPLRDRDGGCALLAEVAAAPAGDHAFGSGPTVLVIVRTARAEGRVARAAAALFDLTPAEAGVAADLVAGRGPADIALARGVSLGTVRTQIRALFDKAGVNSLIGLVAAINRAL